MRASLFYLLALASANPECFEPIHTAAEKGDVARLQKILAKDKYQADAEDKCDTKIYPLLLAANSGSADAVRVLLDAGASVNVAHAGNGVTPLIAAAVAGNDEMLEALIAKRADVDHAEARNWTALSFAAQYGHATCVDQLIAAGANVGWITLTGLTPWMLAADAQKDPPPNVSPEAYDRVLEALVEAGAPAHDESAIYLVGRLPLETLKSLGVTDSGGLERLLGGFQFAKLVAGIDPQAFATHKSILLMQKGEGDKASIEVAKHAVGGGPMPAYMGIQTEKRAKMAESGAEEALLLKFDATPGSGFVWQIIVAGVGEQGGKYFMRGVLQATGEEEEGEAVVGNYLDPVSAKWEIAASIVQKDGSRKTEWVPAPELRMVRGEEGALLAGEGHVLERQQAHGWARPKEGKGSRMRSAPNAKEAKEAYDQMEAVAREVQSEEKKTKKKKKKSAKDEL